MTWLETQASHHHNTLRSFVRLEDLELENLVLRLFRTAGAGGGGGGGVIGWRSGERPGRFVQVRALATSLSSQDLLLSDLAGISGWKSLAGAGPPTRRRAGREGRPGPLPPGSSCPSGPQRVQPGGTLIPRGRSSLATQDTGQAPCLPRFSGLWLPVAILVPKRCWGAVLPSSAHPGRDGGGASASGRPRRRAGPGTPTPRQNKSSRLRPVRATKQDWRLTGPQGRIPAQEAGKNQGLFLRIFRGGISNIPDPGRSFRGAWGRNQSLEILAQVANSQGFGEQLHPHRAEGCVLRVGFRRAQAQDLVHKRLLMLPRGHGCLWLRLGISVDPGCLIHSTSVARIWRKHIPWGYFHTVSKAPYPFSVLLCCFVFFFSVSRAELGLLGKTETLGV